MTIYGKDEAVMTRGLAILSMVILHMFCQDASVFDGKVFLRLPDGTPFVCWLGFFSEICVPLYSLCAGYAYYLLWEHGKQELKGGGEDFTV